MNTKSITLELISKERKRRQVVAGLKLLSASITKQSSTSSITTKVF
jgi:hypothetical protein